MPSYDLRQHDNGFWYIHWTEGRRSRRLSTGQKEAAKAKTFLGGWLVAESAEQKDGASASFQFRELWTVYFEKHIEKSPSEDTITNVKAIGEKLVAHFGDLTPAQITSEKIEEYEKARRTGKIGEPSKPGSIRLELAYVRSSLNWCAHPRHKNKLLKKSDVPVFDMPPASDPRDRWLRTEEIQTLLNAAAAARSGAQLSDTELFLWLALETAARKKAILQLTWDRIDFETGVIHYNVPGRRRTKKKRTSVPMSTALRRTLVRAHAERVTDCPVTDRLPDGRLFTTFDAYGAVVRIAEAATIKDVSPHVLRHTAATHMCRRGVPLWKVAGILGNTVAMVEKVYGHHCPDGLADAVELISAGTLEPAE